MNRDDELLDALGKVNPVPDAADLANSDAAADLALRKAGSVLDWSMVGEEYVADGYRIRLAEPRKWEVSHQGALIAYHNSRKAAFGIVEDHRRDAMRRHDLIRLALTFVLTIVAWVTAGLIVKEMWVLALPFALYFTLSSFIRFFAVFSRNISDPYRRPLPWERRPRTEHLFFGRR